MKKQNFSQNRAVLRRLMLLERQKALQGSSSIRSEACMASEEKAKIGVSGHVTIEAIYPSGETEVLLQDEMPEAQVKRLVSGPNLVVRQAENIMPYMSLGLRSINYIELGDPATPNAPVLADIALQQTSGVRKVVTGSVTGNQVTYEALWLTTEGNGYDFTEAGLFTDPFGAGELFARKTFDPISKNNSFALKFKWALIFKVADHSAGCSGVSLLGSSTVTHDYVYDCVGGEASIIIPIDFIVGGKQLDIYLNGQRLVYNRQYYESSIGSLAKGIILLGWVAKAGDEIYVVNRKLA